MTVLVAAVLIVAGVVLCLLAPGQVRDERALFGGSDRYWTGRAVTLVVGALLLVVFGVVMLIGAV